MKKPTQSLDDCFHRLQFMLEMPVNWFKKVHALLDQTEYAIPLEHRVRAGRGCESGTVQYSTAAFGHVSHRATQHLQKCLHAQAELYAFGRKCFRVS